MISRSINTCSDLIPEAFLCLTIFLTTCASQCMRVRHLNTV